MQCKLIIKYISWKPFALSVLKANCVVILTAVGFRLVKLADQIEMYSCKMKFLEFFFSAFCFRMIMSVNCDQVSF